MKHKGSPLLHFSALCDIFWKKKIKNFKFFLKSLLRFLSLRYSADFRRSRLVLFWENSRKPLRKNQFSCIRPRNCPQFLYHFEWTLSISYLHLQWHSDIKSRYLPALGRQYNSYFPNTKRRLPKRNWKTLLLLYENKNFPPSIFWCFATEWMLKNAKGSLLSVFRHCETFFENLIFLQRVPPTTATKMLTISKESSF